MVCLSISAQDGNHGLFPLEKTPWRALRGGMKAFIPTQVGSTREQHWAYLNPQPFSMPKDTLATRSKILIGIRSIKQSTAFPEVCAGVRRGPCGGRTGAPAPGPRQKHTPLGVEVRHIRVPTTSRRVSRGCGYGGRPPKSGVERRSRQPKPSVVGGGLRSCEKDPGDVTGIRKGETCIRSRPPFSRSTLQPPLRPAPRRFPGAGLCI